MDSRKIDELIKKQLHSQGIGFLLGAGSSFLDGHGYPLASNLWEWIRAHIPEPERTDIQRKIDGGANGIENALDFLDQGEIIEKPHRRLVVSAIAEAFSNIKPPLDLHRRFLRALTRPQTSMVPVFTLNYDPLLEWAAERGEIRLYDGFHGHEHAFFDPQSFEHMIGVSEQIGRGS